MGINSLSFFGCGNMAQAIAKGIYHNRKDLNIYTYTPSYLRAESLANEVSGKAYKSISQIPGSDLYVLGCKPQQIVTLAEEAKNYIPKESIILSLLAATSTDYLSELFESSNIVRTMPNTPILVGAGFTAFYFSKNIAKSKRDNILEIFSHASVVHEFSEENQLDLITPFSGSGPAFIFELANLLSEKARSLGIEKEIAYKAIVETIYGSALMMKTSTDNPETLRNNVTSKKGVTYEALKIFDQYWPESIDKGIDAAILRGKEIAQKKD